MPPHFLALFFNQNQFLVRQYLSLFLFFLSNRNYLPVKRWGLEVSQTIKKKGEPLVAPPGGGTAPALCIVSDPNNSIHFHFDLHI